jgi:Raf kinase inhibitor-like YbhB/YbcL family protein
MRKLILMISFPAARPSSSATAYTWRCGAGESEMALSLKSSAFRNGGAIPRKYTCDGANVSPPLEWSGVSAEAKSLLLACDDPDAPGGLFHHWAAYDIAPDVAELAEIAAGARDSRFRQAINDFGKPGYAGPCPPKGHKPHRYIFRLSALKGRLDGAPSNVRCADIARLAGPIEIDAAELIGYYGRS